MTSTRESETPIPTTEDAIPSTTTPAAGADTTPSSVTEEQWSSMKSLLDYMYDYREGKEDHDPSKLFHRKVNKRMVPDYYDVIKEPMAMSTIKAKINNKEYKDIKEYVRDWALISFNAQVYNLPNSGAYVDALTIKRVVQRELGKFVEDGVLTAQEAEYPVLGEIPAVDENYVMPEMEEEDAEGEDDEEDEDDEDDELDDSDEEGGRRRRRKGARGAAATSKRDRKYKDDGDDPDERKKRGRPPRVDTPLESRIKEILKSMRKFKSTGGSLMVYNFERLPDKTAMPEYYADVKNPIALDVIKKKLKRKKYNNVDVFMKDIELMFENAKSYNTDESQIYQDAVFLQGETRKIAEEVKKKPDTDFASEDGKIPMPDGILHNGELWKVGDWVHIQNANDLTKPVVAQLYRTWQDTDGNKWVNACWYYRPEQTVHRFDRHFYENEVVKTGQYRDHPIDEVVDRCFVMFFTRYNKGRPRNFPQDKEIYVCEARYNEEKHKLNKIKTWASCLPDEVRDKDYEMDLFDAPKKMKKVPSPIKYLYDESKQKESDEMPKPVWGAPNAPPKIGAVHCRPRDPKDSPPPEPTPTPPPQPPPAPARSISAMSVQPSNGYNADSHHRPADIQVPASTPQAQHMTNSSQYTPSHNSHFNQNAMPSPAPMLQPMPASASQYRPSQTPLTPSATSTYQSQQGTQSSTQQPAQQTYQYNNTFATASGPTGYRPPQVNQTHTSTSHTPAPSHTAAQSQTQPPVSQSQSRYEARPDPEVYYLPDHANNSIPEDVRKQFQCDAYGRVLFFTAPPVEHVPSVEKRPGHTAKYLAWKMEREAKVKEARAKRAATGSNGVNEHQAKRQKSVERDEMARAAQMQMEILNDELADATIGEYKAAFGERWREALDMDLGALENGQERVARMIGQRAVREVERRRVERRGLEVRDMGI